MIPADVSEMPFKTPIPAVNPLLRFNFFSELFAFLARAKSTKSLAARPKLSAPVKEPKAPVPVPIAALESLNPPFAVPAKLPMYPPAAAKATGAPIALVLLSKILPPSEGGSYVRELAACTSSLSFRGFNTDVAPGV